MPSLDAYLRTLLLYYEEEIMGEAYFDGLAGHFAEREKLALLARVERRAAEAIYPLLLKYSLTPRDKSLLRAKGESHVERHEPYDGAALISHMLHRYPGYVKDFKALERMAPDEDLPSLEILTDHEVVTIEFARMEAHNEPDSLAPLYRYLGQ
jgi:dimethylamine/trimethylamine dehydrogenase